MPSAASRSGWAGGAGQAGHPAPHPGRQGGTPPSVLAVEAEPLGRGPVPAPADAKALVGRPVPCDEPDCGRRGLLHDQGLARTGLGPPAVHGTRPAHRHFAQGLTSTDRHPPHRPATQRADRDPPCCGRGHGVLHASQRLRHRGKGYTETYTDSDGERHGQALATCCPPRATTARSRASGATSRRPSTTGAKPSNTRKDRNIEQHNLGRRKQKQCRRRHKHRVCNLLCQVAHAVVDKADILACEDLSTSMKSAPYRHRDPHRRLNGWVKGVMADTLTSISLCRGSALVLVNPACTSQIDSRTGLLQGRCCGDRLLLSRRGAGHGHQCRLQHSGEAVGRGDTVVHALQGVKVLLAERTQVVRGLPVPDSSCGSLQHRPHQPRAKHPEPTRFEEQPVLSPVWGMDTGGCGATPGAEFGVRASLRKAIPHRIGESRSFGSLQSELRPNQNWPCLEGQMGEFGLSSSTGRGVRPGVGRVSGCRCRGPVGRESLPMPTQWNPSVMRS